MAITNGYCTLLELKKRLDINDTGNGDTETDSKDDTILEGIIEAVSRLIESAPALLKRKGDVVNLGGTGRTFFASASEVRYFTPRLTDKVVVDDLLTVSEVAVDTGGNRTYTAWATADYDLYPYNATPHTQICIAENGAYGSFPVGIAKALKITGTWGYSTGDSSNAPKQVKEACLLQSQRLFKRKDAPFGIAGNPAVGQLTTITRLDPDVELMLSTFRRKRI